jgi:hypothetical protein
MRAGVGCCGGGSSTLGRGEREWIRVKGGAKRRRGECVRENAVWREGRRDGDAVLQTRGEGRGGEGRSKDKRRDQATERQARDALPAASGDSSRNHASVAE